MALPSTRPTLVAATVSVSGKVFKIPAVTSRSNASASATNAPVTDAVRVPPSASMTSQSTQTVRSPRLCWFMTARSERPMSRWISSVRPDCFPRAASRGVRCSVARGSIPYSLVTQPLPEPFRNWGTPSSTLAVQTTRVFPTSMRTLPSAVEIKSGVSLTGRIWSAARPSFRTHPPKNSKKCDRRRSRLARRRTQFAGRGSGCQLGSSVRAGGFSSGRSCLRLLRGQRRRVARSRNERRRRANQEEAGEVQMAGEGIHLLAVNQDFYPADLRHIGFEGARDGIHGELFALNAGRKLRRQGFGKIGDGRAVFHQVKLEKHGVGRKRAEVGIHRPADQGGENLLCPKHGIRRKAQLDFDRRERSLIIGHGPKELGLHLDVRGRCDLGLFDFAERFSLSALGLAKLVGVAAQAGKINGGHEDREQQHEHRPTRPARHQRPPPTPGSTVEDS